MAWLWAMLVGAVLAMAGLPAAAALLANSIDIPTRIGRGQTVSVQVSYTKTLGVGVDTIVVSTPAQLEVVAPLPSGCALVGAAGSAQTLTCDIANAGSAGDSGSFNFSVRGRTSAAATSLRPAPIRAWRPTRLPSYPAAT